MHFRNSLRALACALLFCFFAGCGAENKADANQRNASDVLNGLRLKQLVKGLSLTGEQQAKVKSLLDEEAKAIAKVHALPNLSILEKSTNVTTLRKETYSKVKPLLTPAQLEKFEEGLRKSERNRTN